MEQHLIIIFRIIFHSWKPKTIQWGCLNWPHISGFHQARRLYTVKRCFLKSILPKYHKMSEPWKEFLTHFQLYIVLRPIFSLIVIHRINLFLTTLFLLQYNVELKMSCKFLYLTEVFRYFWFFGKKKVCESVQDKDGQHNKHTVFNKAIFCSLCPFLFEANSIFMKILQNIEIVAFENLGFPGIYNRIWIFPKL